MKSSARIFDALTKALVASPPEGFTAAEVGWFLSNNRTLFLQQLGALDGPDDAEEEAPEPRDLSKVRERTDANLRAMQVTSDAQRQGRSLTEEERPEVLRYSGWGGLSIEKNLARMPADLKAAAVGLVHEYYTPSDLTRQVAQLLRPLLGGLNKVGTVRALEPSAGIGRFLQPFADPGYEDVRFTAVEMSKVSAAMLRLTAPRTTVYEMPLEEFVTRHPEVDGQLDLVLSNPPYGQRGVTVSADPPYLKQDRAYFYFIERTLGLLREGGLGVYLVPYGFLSGKSKEYRSFREKILLGAHLSAAYRLPSGIFPGAKLVTDLLFFRARGGVLAKPSPADEAILAGRYFAEYPAHILGLEAGETAAQGDDRAAIKTFEEQMASEDRPAPKPRWGYQVEPFRDAAGQPLPLRLPEPLEERPFCFECELRPQKRQGGKVVVATPVVDAAVRLGKRVAKLQGALSRGDDQGKEIAQTLHAELMPALKAWHESNGNPWKHQDLLDTLKSPDVGATLNTFLSAYDRATGTLASALATLPPFTPRFQGKLDDIDAQGRWYFRQQGILLPEPFAVWHRQQGGSLGRSELLKGLIDAGWAWDRGELFPEEVYYSGYLWPKYDRAKAYPSDEDYVRQVERLHALIQPKAPGEVFFHYKDQWIPIEYLELFFKDCFPRERIPPLERTAGGIGVKGVDYTLMSLGLVTSVGGEEFPARMLVLIGLFNDDTQLWVPEKESPEQTIAEARIAYRVKIEKRWEDFLKKHPDLVAELTARYNRLYKGYVAPSFAKEPLNLRRWSESITLRPHQEEAAQQLSAARRGLLCFTVGVGKTYTGCAIIAKARQEGWARRPVVCVPNNLLMTWVQSLSLALPDYRVGIIGSERFVTASGKVREQTDTPEARSQKWRAFQRGEYDVMLITYSMLRRTALSEDLGPVVAGLVSLDENLKHQLAVQSRNRLKTQIQKEKTRDKEMEAREKLVNSLAARVYTYPDDGKYVLYADGVRSELSTQEEADEARRQAIVKLARDLVADQLIEKDAKKKKPTKREPGQDVLDALWKRALIDKGFMQLSDLSEQERAEEEAAERTRKMSMSERSRAISDEAGAAFAARFLAPRKGERFDPDIYWDQLGVDLFITDEIQNAKNRDAVANRALQLMYLGAIAEGSDFAWQMYFRTSVVRRYTGSLMNKPLRIEERGGVFRLYDGDVVVADYERRQDVEDARAGWEAGRTLAGGGGIFGLSGTPVKNSPLELYVQLTYVAPEVLRRVGITTVHAFMAKYLDTEVKTIVTPKLSLESRDAVVGFMGLEELRGLFYAIGIYKTPLDVGLKIPEADRDVKYVQKSEEQRLKYKYYAFLYQTNAFRPYILGLQVRMQLVGIHADLDGAKTADLAGLVNTIEEMRLAAKAQDQARSESLRQELSRRMNAFFLRDSYEETSESGGGGDGDEEGGEGGGDEVGGWTWENADEQPDPHSPKFDACADAVVARPGCGHIIFVDNVVAHKWMRRVLIARGVPKDRIALLNGKVGGMKQREEIALGFTGRDELLDADGVVLVSGEDRKYDVLIANRVANEGMNLQRETCMLHHLDLPWEPATLEQRNGRGVRQGNKQESVGIRYYVVTASMDVVRLQQILGKAKWTDALFRSGVSNLRNPLAERDDDAAIFMAEDPEKAMEEAKEKRAKLEKLAQAKRAWAGLRGLYHLARQLHDDPAGLSAATAEPQIAQVKQNLGGLSEADFPYAFLADVLDAAGRAGRRAEFLEGEGVLWEGAVYGGDAAFTVHQIQEDTGYRQIAIRRPGTIEMELLSPPKWVRLWEETYPGGWKLPWPTLDDEARVRERLPEWMASFGYGGFERTKLEYATNTYRTWLWEEAGGEIVKALRKSGRTSPTIVLPALDAAGRLVLLEGQKLGLIHNAKVLPFTDEGYAQLLAAAPEGPAVLNAEEGVTDDWTYSDLSRTARFWWGRSIPRDLLSRARKEAAAAPAPPAPAPPAALPPAAPGRVVYTLAPRDFDYPTAQELETFEVPSAPGMSPARWRKVELRGSEGQVQAQIDRYLTHFLPKVVDTDPRGTSAPPQAGPPPQPAPAETPASAAAPLLRKGEAVQFADEDELRSGVVAADTSADAVDVFVQTADGALKMVPIGVVIREEARDYQVVLLSGGRTPVKVVEVIKLLASLPLGEAVTLVNRSKTGPVVVRRGLEEGQAEALRVRIADAGGEARVEHALTEATG